MSLWSSIFKYMEEEYRITDLETIKKRRKIRTADLVNILKIPPEKLSKTTEEDKLTPKVKWELVISTGPMESGKTTLALTMAWELERYYWKRHGLKTVSILADELVSAIRMIPNDAEVI